MRKQDFKILNIDRGRLLRNWKDYLPTKFEA